MLSYIGRTETEKETRSRRKGKKEAREGKKRKEKEEEMKRKREEREERLKQRKAIKTKPPTKKRKMAKDKSCSATPATATGSTKPSTQPLTTSAVHTDTPTSTEEPASTEEPVPKKRKFDKSSEETSEEIDDWVCSFCFGNYADDDGTEWICCGCKRWVHEECVEEVIVDTNGVERFCPYCTSLLG